MATHEPQFRLEEHPLSGARLLVAAGEMDIATAPELDAALTKAAREGSEPVIVDLCEVTFMDSTGLRTLLRGRQRLDQAGVRMAIACSSDAVRKVFDLTKTAELLDVAPDREGALSSLRGV